MRYFAVRNTATVLKIRNAPAFGRQSMFPVITEDRHLLGYISNDDFKDYSDDKTAGDVLADAIKQGKLRIQRARASEPLEVALATMRDYQLQFLPVVDRYDRFVGTIDDSDADSSAASRLVTW